MSEPMSIGMASTEVTRSLYESILLDRKHNHWHHCACLNNVARLNGNTNFVCSGLGISTRHIDIGGHQGC